MFDNLRADFAAASAERTLERGWWSVLLRYETPAVVQYRFAHWVLQLRVPVVRPLLQVVALIWQRLNQMFLGGVLISPDAEVGPGMVLHTCCGLNIGPVKIGEGCTFNHGVLIASGVKGIGDNVYFGGHAKVLGDVRIGNNVLVVANSVVLTDVPDNTTVMGVPARIRLPGGRPKRFPWKVTQANAANTTGDQERAQKASA